MNPDFAQIKADAMTNAAKLMAQSQAPSFGPGAYPEVTALNAPEQQLKVASGLADASVFNSGVTNERAKQDLENQITSLKKKSSKEGYKRVKRPDGGFGFYDNDGNEISAYEYANAIGSTPADVLKDSENPIDIGYQQDWANMNDLFNAMLNKDEVLLQEYYDQNPSLQGKTINDVIDAFKNAYPTVYGKKQRGVPVGSLYVPTAGSTGGSEI